MFSAINEQNGETITILDRKWENAVDCLRLLDRQNILVCQLCKKPVRIRAGEIRLWHFAHKHLQNCPYGRESPERLKARAVLYEWLVAKFGDKVALEKQLDDDRLHLVDCWVEYESEVFLYWIFDKSLNPDSREHIQSALARLSAKKNWVFTVQMLREEKGNPNQIHLTTTEREFMRRTDYDKTYGPGDSLHYLNADEHTLTTFRGLQLVHSPQLHEGHKESRVLSEVLVSPKSGEFVHPGEHELLIRFLQRQKELEKSRKESIEKQRASMSMCEPISRTITTPNSARIEQVCHDSAYTITEREGICEFCGKKTTNWWSFDGRTGLCKCNDCKRKDK